VKKIMHARHSWLAVVSIIILQHTGLADEPYSLKKYTAPADNNKDEPIAKKFSLDQAAQFLDGAALDWTKKHGCFSCHTNYAFLYARPMVSAEAPAHADIRAALEEMVGKTWVQGKPRWDTEVVTTAAALAYNDSLTTKKLHKLTRSALDRMWTVQRKDGGISWYKCGLPPMEQDDHYGVTLAALATGVAPEGYAKTEAAQKGLTGLRTWLKANPPQNLHHRTMLLWVSSYLDDFVTPDERTATIKAIRAKQLGDGGWSAAGMGDWKRRDKLDQDTKTSDGYGTGFSIYVLRQAGVDASDPAIQKGLAWLKSNQRESGRWFTRSLTRDDKHYLTDVGSAFAVMAIQSCVEAKMPLTQAPAKEKERADYRSPYSVKFTLPLKDLVGDLENSERGDYRKASTFAFAEWSGKRVLDAYGPWGPPARHFPAPEKLAERSLEWQRQRVIAVGLRFQGYGYQHHHIPDWDPPKDWPWKETKGGHNGKGVDCSNFTAFVYNLGLGIKPTGNVKKQADQLEHPGPGPNKTTHALRIEKPATYAELTRTLQTGDLLFIRNKKGEISHVVLWVGAIGQAPDGSPLILDSHGDGVKDSNGNSIPHGIYLRPFRENSWYFQSASHAIRVLHAERL
jgi:squalene-hopene/tetraprenyl-beta-curcumene cyclase